MMKCSGDHREATHVIWNGKAHEPHCQNCFDEAMDSTVLVPAMSIDAYERMMRDVKQSVAS